MWKELIAITKFVVRCRVEPGASVACRGNAGQEDTEALGGV